MYDKEKLKIYMDTLIIDPIKELKKLLKLDWDKIQNYYNRYSEEDHKTYAYLEEQVMSVWPGRVHPEIIKGAYKLGVGDKKIPLLSLLDRRLNQLSNFGYFYSEGVTPDTVLMAGYKRRVFPSTLFLRSWEDRDYTPAPDLFHEDRAGHGAALSILPYADVCQKIGAIAEAFRFHPVVMEIMDKVHWYLVEFPLVVDGNNLLIVGPGIISSPKECHNSLENPDVKRYEIDPEKSFEVFDHVCSTKKEIYHLQDELWVFRSFRDFKHVMNVALPKYLQQKTGILPLPY